MTGMREPRGNDGRYGFVGVAKPGSREPERKEEGEYEYASDHQGSEGHAESGVLTQPLEGLEDGSGGTSEGSMLLIAGGCPSTHDPCYPKHGKSGKRNEGGTGTSCRSGAQSKGKCVEGKEGGKGIQNACELVGIAVGAAGLADVPAAVAAAIFGGGSGAVVACRELG